MSWQDTYFVNGDYWKLSNNDMTIGVTLPPNGDYSSIVLDNQTQAEEEVRELKTAIYYNDRPPFEWADVRHITCVWQGERDGPDWVWVVRTGVHNPNSYRYPDFYLGVGSSDYTGWDCQSSLKWTKIT